MNNYPVELSLFLLKKVVLFPHTALPLRVFEARYKEMIARCLAMPVPLFGVILIKAGPEVESTGSVSAVTAVPHSVGTLGRIVEVDRKDDGTIDLVLLGSSRFQIEDVVQEAPYLIARVTYMNDHSIVEGEVLSDLVETAQRLGKQHLRLVTAALGGSGPEDKHVLDRVWKESPRDPSAFSFFLGGLIQTVQEIKQRLLDQETTEARLRDEINVLTRENEILRSSLRHRRNPSKSRFN